MRDQRSAAEFSSSVINDCCAGAVTARREVSNVIRSGCVVVDCSARRLL